MADESGSGNTDTKYTDDPQQIVNMSVWETAEALEHFVWDTAHKRIYNGKHAWFEKPALLYWLSGAGFRFGLGPGLAPRLPVALVAVGFLVFYWWILWREFGCRAAWMATLILGTSGAWLGFSQVAVPDLLLTATFSAARMRTPAFAASTRAKPRRCRE